jgi:hypothetical protein
MSDRFDGVDDARSRHQICQRVIVSNESPEGVVHMRINAIDVDLAKNVFQIHGVDESGKVVVSRQLRHKQVIGFFAANRRRALTPVLRAGSHLRQARAGPGRHGSLRPSILLGARVDKIAHTIAHTVRYDAAELRKRLRQADTSGGPRIMPPTPPPSARP